MFFYSKSLDIDNARGDRVIRCDLVCEKVYGSVQLYSYTVQFSYTKRSPGGGFEPVIPKSETCVVTHTCLSTEPQRCYVSNVN